MSHGPRTALRGGPPVRRRPFTRWPIHDDSERRNLLEVLDGGEWSYEGPRERVLAERFSLFCDSAFAVLTTSGTTSLEIAVRAMGIGPGDEVIVPALTWTAPAWAVIRSGADVVFADVGRDWCLDPQTVEASISNRTRAVIVVHTYCQIAEIDALRSVTERHGLALFEDCAHVPGARWRNRAAGSFGSAGTFSFQLGKSMTAGEGGAIVTNDAALAQRCYSMKNCGRPTQPDTDFAFAGNLRITEFQAAILLAQLDRLDEQIDHRTKMFSYFRAAMARVPGLKPLAAKPEMTRQGVFAFAVDYEPEQFEQVPVDVLVSALNAEGVPAKRPHMVVYKSPMWRAGLNERFWHPGSDPAARLGLGASCPIAEDISNRTGFVLPHQLFLGTEEDIDDVVEAFAKLKSYASELKQ